VARGGARVGAGRKPGSSTKLTREIANRIAESGDTPLDALSDLRRWAMDCWRSAVIAEDFLIACKAAEVAAEYAAKEAPYVHPRLAATDVKVSGGLTHEDALANLR
jgi:hypothetical protein